MKPRQNDLMQKAAKLLFEKGDQFNFEKIFSGKKMEEIEYKVDEQVGEEQSAKLLEDNTVRDISEYKDRQYSVRQEQDQEDEAESQLTEAEIPGYAKKLAFACFDTMDKGALEMQALALDGMLTEVQNSIQKNRPSGQDSSTLVTSKEYKEFFSGYLQNIKDKEALEKLVGSIQRWRTFIDYYKATSNAPYDQSNKLDEGLMLCAAALNSLEVKPRKEIEEAGKLETAETKRTQQIEGLLSTCQAYEDNLRKKQQKAPKEGDAKEAIGAKLILISHMVRKLTPPSGETEKRTSEQVLKDFKQFFNEPNTKAGLSKYRDSTENGLYAAIKNIVGAVGQALHLSKFFTRGGATVKALNAILDEKPEKKSTP